MKIRNDFVTNSSSSSFIVCFARIADEEKAKKILEQYPSIRQYTAQEVLENIKDTRWSKWLEYVERIIKETLDKMEGKSVFVEVSYSDNNGEYFSELEHRIMPRLASTMIVFDHH